MKILRELKYLMKNKKTKIFLIISLLVFILIYFSYKNELFYRMINYFENYLSYYIDYYLNGNINDLLVGNYFLIYIEGDLANVLSSLYIYIVTYSSYIFMIFSFIIILVIYYLINNKLHGEIYNKFSIPQINRIGINKYVNKTILVNTLYGGLIILIPRVIYFVILLIFFPDSVSFTHYVTDASFVSEAFLFTSYNISPWLLILLDFILCYLYGMILSFISILVTSLVKNKPLSYVVYIFVIGVISILFTLVKKPALFAYISIFNYYNYLNILYMTNICEPIIYSLIMLLVLFVVVKVVLKVEVKKNI